MYAPIVTGQLKLKRTSATGPSTNVRCGLLDQSGNLWFGTTGQGIYRFDGKWFVNYTVEEGLSNNYVWDICEDKNGLLWFATADGACTFDGTKFIRYPVTVINGSSAKLGFTFIKKFSVDQYGNPSEDNAVWNILQDKTGDLWFGLNDGMARYNGTSFTRQFESDGIKKVEAILEDKEGNIWFGGRGTEGALRFDGKVVSRYTPDGKNWVWPGLQDKAGNIWFTNWGGAYYFDGKVSDQLHKNTRLLQYGYHGHVAG